MLYSIKIKLGKEKCMQLNRLFEIVYILLNRKQVTARELAQRFEVSTRTIYRDIESLTEAGVPVYTNKGKGGGISLLDNFILNKSYLNTDEQQEILTALQGLKVTAYTPQNQVIDKLSALFGSEEEEWITVDFGSWDTSEKEKFDLIKMGILSKKRLQFDYYNTKMEKLNRRVEPIQLYFKERTWYLKAYCMVRKEMRLFKLRRMRNIICLEETFKPYSKKQETQSSTYTIERNYDTIKMWIDSTQAYRVFDEFEEEQVIIQEDGSFIVTLKFPKDEWTYGYLLSFGSYAKVIEPREIQDEIRKRLEKALGQY